MRALFSLLRSRLMRPRLPGWLGAVFVLVFLGAGALWPVEAREPNTLTIGMFAYRPVSVLEPAWRPLAWYLQEQVPGVHVNIRFLDQDAMTRALERDELDLVFTNPAHYITLRTQNQLSGAIATLVALEEGKAVSQLGGVLIRRKERTDIQRWQDLPGKVVAVTGTQYLGGYATQAKELVQRGIALDSIEFKRLGNPHDKVIAAVLEGQADAGFIRTGILESLHAEGKAEVADLEVVEPVSHSGFPFKASTALYPEWAMVALPHLDRDLSRRISAALLALEPEDVLSQLAGIHGFTIPADYQSVQEAMMAARVPPFDKAPTVSIREFARQHAAAVIAVGSILLTVMIASAWVLRTNRRLNLAQGRLAQERQRLEDIIEGTNAGTWEWYVAEDRIVYGRRWAAMLGYTLEELEPVSLDTWKTLTHPVDQQEVLAQLDKDLAAGVDAFESEFRMRHKAGHWVWIHNLSRIIRRTEDGKPLLLTGIHLDVTERKRNEEERALSHSVFLRTHTGVMVTDESNRIVQINPAFTEITGYAPEEVLGKSPDMLASGEHDEAFYRELWNDLEVKGEWEGEIVNRHKNGHTVPERMTISVVRDADGAIQHYIGVFTDISLQKQLVRELQHSAHHDLLTGLPNRALLYDRLGLALAQARRARSSVAVIFLDLDGFKPVNDTYGHVAGDELLRRLAQRMRGVVRDGDTLARLGGDEFVVVANAVADEADATACAERVLAAIGEPVTLETAAATVCLSASVGVVVCPPTASEEGALPEAVLGRADALMYEAKRAGKARVVVQRFVP